MFYVGEAWHLHHYFFYCQAQKPSKIHSYSSLCSVYCSSTPQCPVSCRCGPVSDHSNRWLTVFYAKWLGYLECPGSTPNSSAPHSWCPWWMRRGRFTQLRRRSSHRKHWRWTGVPRWLSRRLICLGRRSGRRVGGRMLGSPKASTDQTGQSSS